MTAILTINPKCDIIIKKVVTGEKMEIAELVLSVISTVVAVRSFIFAFLAKKETKNLNQEINFILENNSNIKTSKNYNQKQSKTIKNNVKGDNNITGGGNIDVK